MRKRRDFSQITSPIIERQQVEEWYETILRTAMDGFWVADTEGRMLDVNDAYCRLIGYSRDELLSMRVQDVEAAETPEKTAQHIQRVIEMGSDRFETRHRRKDGGIVDLEVSVNYMDVDGGRFFVFLRDITERKQALAEADILARVAGRVSQTLELDEVLDTALSEALSALGITNGCIYVFDPTGKLVIRTQRQLSAAFLKAKGVISPGEGCAGTAAVTKEMFAPTEAERRFVCEESERLLGLDCLAAIPIVYGGETLGVLELFAPVARRLSPRERAVAEAISNQLSMALQNARLYAAQRNIADTLQKALLTVPDKIDGLDFGDLYHSATVEAEVGGDFYDLFELEHGRVGLIVGDVYGKGVGAATLTSLVKNTAKAYAHQEESPGRVLAKTNNMVVGTSATPMFATVFFGILNIGSGNFRYCSAGHPPAILKRKTEISTLATASPPIGVLAGLKYTDGQATVERGDILVVYTDGAIEARRDGEFFGEERLVKLVRELEGATATELPQLIFNEIADFSGGSLADDLAILTVTLPETA